MDSSIVRSFRRALEQIEIVFTTILDTALTYIGATEDSSVWWKAVFERRILKGDVGISIRWFHSKKMDVLWELESLVKSLSRENQGSTEKLSKGDDSPTKHSTSAQCGTGKDNNLNNYWFTDQSRNPNLHLRKSNRYAYTDYTKRDERKAWYSTNTKRVSKHCQVEQTLCDLNQSSADYAGNNFSEIETYMDLTNGLGRHQESVTQGTKPRFDLISPPDGVKPQRSNSCPDVVYTSQDLSSCNKVKASCSLTCATSLHSLHSQDDVSDNVILHILARDKNSSKSTSNIHFDWDKDTVDSSYCSHEQISHHVTEENSSDINQKDWNLYTSVDLDKLLLHKNTLNMLWEDNLSPETEIHSLSKVKVKENQSDMTANCAKDGGNNNCENSSLKTCSNTNSVNKPPQELFDYPTALQESSRVQHTPPEEHDPRNPVATSGSIISNVVRINSKQDEHICGMNWNAFVDDGSSSVDKQDVTDYHGGASYQSSFAWNTPMSAARPSDLNIPTVASVSTISRSSACKDGHHKYRERFIESFAQSVEKDDKIKSNEAELLTKEKTAVRILTVGDKPITSNRPLKNSTQPADLSSPQALEAAETGDMKFDIVNTPELVNPKMWILRRLGLKSVKNPKQSTIHTEDEYCVNSETQTWSSRSARVPFNMVQQSFLGIIALLMGRRNEDSKEQMKKANSNNSQPSVRTEKTNAPEVRYYLTGRSAYMYYKLLAMTEAKYKIARLHAEHNYFMQLYKWKQDTLGDVVRIAKDYYSDPTEMNLARWKTLKRTLSKEHQSYTDVRMQVSKIPDYYPYFTFALVLVCLIALLTF